MALKDAEAENEKQWQLETAPTSEKCSAEQPTKSRQTERKDCSTETVNAMVRERVRHLLPAINFSRPRTQLRSAANVLQQTDVTGEPCQDAGGNNAIIIPSNSDLPGLMVPDGCHSEARSSQLLRPRFPRLTSTVSLDPGTNVQMGEHMPWTRNFLTRKQPLGSPRAPKPAKEYRVPNSTPVHGMKQSTVEIPVRTPVFKYSKLIPQPKRKIPSGLFPNITAIREYQKKIVEHGKTADIFENGVPTLSLEIARCNGPTHASEHRQSKPSKLVAVPRSVQALELPISTMWTSKQDVAHRMAATYPMVCNLPLQANARGDGHPNKEVRTEHRIDKNDVTIHCANPKRWEGDVTPAPLTTPHNVYLPPLIAPRTEQVAEPSPFQCGCVVLPKRLVSHANKTRRQSSTLARRRWAASSTGRNQRRRLQGSHIDSKTVKWAQQLFNQTNANRSHTQTHRSDGRRLFKRRLRELSKRLRRVCPSLSQSVTNILLHLH